MKLYFHKYNLELKHPFAISRWTYTHIPSLIVELSGNGISGFGEATHNPYYPNTALDYMSERLSAIQGEIDSTQNLAPEQFWNTIAPYLKDCPFALCALDQAYHDWFTRSKGVPLYEYWGLDIKNTPPNSYTLSIDHIDTMIERMRENPWNIYKIKLGTSQDIEMVKTLRQHSEARFWVDANCAWSVEETIKKSYELANLGVDFIEQPLPADQWIAMEEVFKKSALPVIADESCKTIDDIEKCKNRFHGINIKAMKCGGLTPAIKMIREAKNQELSCMMGCMTESTVGISAIAQLSPLLDYADMDGQHFIKNDPASGVSVSGEGFAFPDRPGTGVSLKKTGA